MDFYQSYTEAFQSVFETKSFSVAHLYKLNKNINIDTLGCYKLFYFVSGNKKFNIGNKTYDCKDGDLFLIPVNDYHYFSNFQNSDSHERIVCFVYPEYLKNCSSETTDLCNCFSQIEATGNYKLSLRPDEQKHFLYHMTNLSETNNYGQDLLDRSNFTKFFIFLNQLYQKHSGIKTEADSKINNLTKQSTKQIDFLKSYIHQHITETLSTKVLANTLFLSPTYLCRLFKETTGTTLHKYITAQRITLAKGLLAEGVSVTDTCSACGFNDYSNFLKAFTKTVGISPKKYAQLSK